MTIGSNDWVLVLGWAINTALGFAGVFERAMIYAHHRTVETDPDLPVDLRVEARFRREISMRRVWLKLVMTVICILELAVVWDRWWSVDYDFRDLFICVTMTAFLVWMLTWRDP